jgi:multidrug efflux pump subunit AcrB
MKILTAFFVRRPLLVRLIMLFILIAGALALRFQTYEMFPTIDLGIFTVTAYRPGSSPEDMELSITVPLEEEILKVDGLEKIYSSSMESMSVISIRMDPDVKDTRRIFADIQKAVDRGSTKLPTDLLQAPLVEQMSTRTIPVIEIHVTGNVPEMLLRQTSDQIADGLREVKGISGVDKVAYRNREVKIYVNPDRLQHLGIPYREIIDAIKRRNVRDSGGSLDSFIAEKKVLTVGQFSHPKEVEQVIIRSSSPGNHVRLRDVAEVVLDYEDWQVRSLIDGVQSILVLPKKKPSADGVKASAAVREFVRQTQKTAPPGVKLVIVNDLSRFTFDMLDVLISNGVLGLILLFAVLLTFFNFRLAFWVSVGLPVAILLTLLVMPIFDMGINTLTLMMLILLFGMLVDDAIVTAESIYAHREKGIDPQEASIAGRAVVAGPVIVSTFTTILAFAPLMFLGGLEGKFLWYIPAMVALLLAASLFECQFMLPCHLAHGGKKPLRPKQWFSRFQSLYDRHILRIIRWRYLTISIFVLGFAGIIVLGVSTLKFNLYPETDIDTFNIKVELPEGSSFEYTIQKVNGLEKLVRAAVPQADLLNIASKIGQHNTDFYGGVEGRNPAWALITVYMLPQGQRKINSNDIIADLRQQFKTMKSFQSLQVEPLKDTPVAGKPVELELIGNAPGRFALADLILEFLKKYPGVTETWTSYKPGKDIVELILDHAAMSSRGLTAADVTRAVRIAFDGLIVDELQTVDEEIRYRLQFRPSEQGKLETLRNLIVVNDQGKAIPVRGFAELEPRSGEAAIKHYFGQRTITVYADIDRNVVEVEKVNRDLGRFIEEEKLLQRFPGMRAWFGGELEQQREALGNIQFAFLVCVLSIFFILVILFNSLTQPFLIMIIIPFGLTGVVIGFTLQGIEMSFLALIGILGLVGVLVNDSLVMVANLNRLKGGKAVDSKDRGRHLHNQEIADGAGQRLRPIVITSLTTCAGLFPTAYGIAGSNPFITPMVMAMFWGILFGTLMSLVLLPCLYAADQDVKKLFGKVFVRMRQISK